MSVPGWVWALTVALLMGLVLFDFFFRVRKAHIPTLREAALWSAIYTADAAERERIFVRLCDEEEQLTALPPKLRSRIREEEKLQTLLRKAHDAHGDFIAGST